MKTGDQGDILGRLQALLPRWFGTNPPLLTELLNRLAFAHAFVYAMLDYARKQTRIATATDSWLDMIATDFLGGTVVRRQAEGDDAFRARIRLNMFRERGTRSAVARIVKELTGRTPIICEPARPSDTGAYGGNELLTIVGTPQIWKSDWQGNQLQYATARTNYAANARSAWGANAATIATTSQIAPDGSTNALIGTSTAIGYSSWTTPYLGPVTTNGSIIEHVWLKAGTVNSMDFGIWDSQGWGNASTVATARIVSGSGSISSNGGAFYHVSGLSANSWTLVEITRTGFGGDTPVFYFYPRQANASQAGDSFIMFALDAKPGLTYSSYIPTTTAAVTVTDYGITGSGLVTFANAPPAGASLSWTGSAQSAMLGQTLTLTNALFGIGDGVTTSWQIARPYSCALAYDMTGRYGWTGTPMQALITVFKSQGAGIPYLGGYGSMVMGYGAPSSGAWADLGMVQNAISDADIYAAIDSVRPAASVLWTQIVGNNNGKLDYTFMLDQSTLAAANTDVLDTSFVLDQSTLQAAPAAYLDQNFTLDTSSLS